MLDINHILVVLDQEHPEQYALDRAVWLAKATNSDLTLMTCAWDTYGDDSARIDEATRHSIKGALSQRAQSWLDSLLEDRDVANVTVRTEVHWQKHLHDGAIESIRNTDFDLVIKGTQPHTLLQRIFTHTDWNLMRHCPAPVMLVKSATPWKHNRVLAAIDSTSRDTGHELINDNILSFAEHLADHFETDLHLANAYPMVAVAFAMVPEVTAPDDIQKYITEQHEEGCAAWAKKFNIADDHIHIGEGDTDVVIADIAKETEADLVVVGTIGRGGLSGVLIGNTAEALVDKLECDILVIKPQDGVRPDIS
ncbi:MAG: universal stress protein UspE [Thalassobium sp.]|uniref:universal stress protein UspE n=1 Tax=Thalassolituus sp. TaxID=2030822 RepID=UPI000BD25908|nr:MAG: universal stress protein UspE [Oceanospirillales bacterium]PHQ87431.1 MAG: universal stress protein UspE [Thalassobium sp.]